MSEAPSLTRDQISAAIAEKAWRDEAFHQAVLADANTVFAQSMGQPVPDGMTIKVLEDTPTTVHFVLPARPANAAELSDAELEAIAGGATPLTGAVVAGVTFVGTFAIKVGLHATNAKW